MATTPDPSYVLNSTLSAQIDKSGCITAVDVQVVEQACVDRKESFSNDILSMVYRPLRDRDHVSTEHPQIEIIREEGTRGFVEKIHSHTAKDPFHPERHILIGLLEPRSLLGTSRGLDFVSSRMQSNYYSSIKLGENPSLEIWYNLLENHTISPIDLRVTLAESLVRQHEPVYFKYKFTTGQTVYLLSKSNPPDLRSLANLQVPRIHPFSIHLRLLYQEIQARSEPMADMLSRMLDLEERFLFKPLQEVMDPGQIKCDLQELHKQARYFAVSEHRNGRDLSNIENLLRDLERLIVETTKNSTYVQIDPNVHQRVKDGFLSLQYSCHNTARRTHNRRERVQNIIALLYNLMANRDSIVNQNIAADSAKIARESMATAKESANMARESAAMAREMRRDSAAMKTIATLTMLYLPATFVSSLFGSNFFALSMQSAGGTTFVVSPLWWILPTVAIPLTLFTIGIWVWWMAYRKKQDHKDSAIAKKRGA